MLRLIVFFVVSLLFAILCTAAGFSPLLGGIAGIITIAIVRP